MVYYVNEDKGDNAATIHRDGCSYAMERDKKKQNGEWHGPFTSKDEALEVAQNTGRRDVKEAECVNRN